eukprot:3430129-Pyramimonas_sp.AAC.1
MLRAWGRRRGSSFRTARSSPTTLVSPRRMFVRRPSSTSDAGLLGARGGTQPTAAQGPKAAS